MPEEISLKKLLVIDGALGTQMIERGLRMGDCPDLWNIEEKDKLREIHQNYIDAGAQVITANTFGGNPIKLSDYKLQGIAEELNRAAIDIVKSVCPPGILVAADMGPTGRFLPPVGDGSIEAFEESFVVQADIIKKCGVDLILIETMYDLREALVCLKAAKRIGVPVYVTMTFDRKKRGFFTIMGDEASVCMKTLEENGADAVGANCTLDSAGFVELTPLLKQSVSKPIIVQPNAGQPVIVEGRATYNETPENFAKNMKLIIEAGADIIGSCCGSSPVFTKENARLAGVRT
jgi:5-methyltetrahydrofolate--homocysteine methyltransferase